MRPSRPITLLACAAAGLIFAPALPVQAAQAAPVAPVGPGGVTAQVTPTTATLGNAVVTRSWALRSDGTVVTTSLRSARSGTEWSGGASPDFLLTVDGVPATSTTGFALIGVTAADIPADATRPAATGGRELVFRYALGSVAAAAAGVELDRTVVLREGSGVLETTSVLVSHGPAARIGQWSVEELTPRAGLAAQPAQVLGYSGGSDYRDDYRHALTEAATFDDEGETARFDDGTGAGWFLVSQRRGGAASRVARDASGRTWVGVDPGRDLFDFGPLRSDPPDYNRLENPAYPVPVRERTLPALGSLPLGTGFLGVYGDGLDRGAAGAAAAFAEDFTTNVAPQFPLTIGQNSFHPWNHGDGMSDLNLRHQVDAAASLGITTYMLDDQWQGGTGGESGDWHFDPARFPGAETDGVPDFVDYLHAKGLTLGLWMSIANFNSASTTYAAHPDWACAPTGDASAQVPDDAGLGVWDMTNPDLRAYLQGVIDRLVTTLDVREFKFDFQSWVDCGAHDYNDYEDAFVGFVRDVEHRHPGVTVELDETNDQRAWPFESAALGPSWFDNGHLHGSGKAAKLLHDLWSAAPWVPASGIGSGAFDGTLDDGCDGPCTAGYLAPLMLLGHATYWTDTTKLPPAAVAEAAWWARWYAGRSGDLRGVVYEDTATDPLAGSGVTVLQPWRDGAGELFAFRQADGDAVTTIGVQAVDPAVTYSVTDVRTGELVATRTGAQLRAGLPVELATPWSARVLRIAPLVDAAAPAAPAAPAALPEAPLVPLLLLPVGVVALARRRRRA